MTEVTRWDQAGHSYGDTWMEPTDDGDWVLWGDYEALAAERDRLADENARMRDALRKLSTAMPRIDIDPLDFLREFVRPTARAALKGDGHE